MPNPFTQPEQEYVDLLDTFSDLSRTNQPSSRYDDTQKEWFYNQYKMRYEQSLDASERIRCELLLRSRDLGFEVTCEDTVDEFLNREDVKEALMIGESQD